MINPQDTDLESVIHVIQTSLTPIFLLTAVAGLLGIFTTRLARISDQVTSLANAEPRTRPEELALASRLAHLRRRSQALDTAVILGAVSGALTCGTVLALFLGALRQRDGDDPLRALRPRGLLHDRRVDRVPHRNAAGRPGFAGRRDTPRRASGVAP